MSDPYEILGLTKNASKEQIKDKFDYLNHEKIFRL